MQSSQHVQLQYCCEHVERNLLELRELPGLQKISIQFSNSRVFIIQHEDLVIHLY